MTEERPGAEERPGTEEHRHARHRLDPALQNPVRFSVVAALATVDEAEFAAVRDAVEVTDSVLSKQSAALEEVGYVKVRKGYAGRRPRTWLSLTANGREAWTRHIVALQEIASIATPQQVGGHQSLP